MCSTSAKSVDFFDEEIMLHGLNTPKSQFSDKVQQIFEMTAMEYLNFCVDRSPLFCGNGISSLQSYAMVVASNGVLLGNSRHNRFRNMRIVFNNAKTEVISFSFYCDISDEA